MSPATSMIKLSNEASLGVKSSSRTLVFLYRKVLLQYEKRGLQCHVCGNKRTFVPNPVFSVTADPDYATQECTLRGTVHAKCLHCLFSAYVSQ
jgi:hypothetical protein